MPENISPAAREVKLKIRQQKIRDMEGKNKHIRLSDNSKVILEKRYLRKNHKGEPQETIEGMFERVARVVAEPDAPYRDVERTKQDFYCCGGRSHRYHERFQIRHWM